MINQMYRKLFNVWSIAKLISTNNKTNVIESLLANSMDGDI